MAVHCNQTKILSKRCTTINVHLAHEQAKDRIEEYPEADIIPNINNQRPIFHPVLNSEDQRWPRKTCNSMTKQELLQRLMQSCRKCAPGTAEERGSLVLALHCTLTPRSGMDEPKPLCRAVF